MIMELYTSVVGPHLHPGPRKNEVHEDSQRPQGLVQKFVTRLGVGIRKIEKFRVTLPKTITKACPPPELIFGMWGFARWVPVSERNEENITGIFWDTLHDLTPKVNLYMPRKINKNPYLYRKNL